MVSNPVPRRELSLFADQASRHTTGYLIHFLRDFDGILTAVRVGPTLPGIGILTPGERNYPGCSPREVAMHGNPIYHALALAAATLLILPLPVAILAGWTPSTLPSRSSAVAYAWALVCLYAMAPLNTIPRMAGASMPVVTGCTVAGVAFSAIAAALLIRTAWVARRPPAHH